MTKHVLVALATLTLCLAGCAPLALDAERDAQHNAPELIVVNAKVVTVDDQASIAQAFAVRDGRFLAVGDNAQIRAMAGAATRIIDAQGRTVTPGLNDGHIHMVRAGFWWKYEARLDETQSLAEILDIIKTRAQQTPRGTWILTLGGWHHSQIKERRMPTRAELDAAAPDHPVYVQALREVGQMNSMAMKLSGITASMPLPPGVSIGKDAAGQFDGVIRGFAGQTLAERSFPQQSFEDKVEGLRLVMRDFNAAGLTSTGETFGIGVAESDYQVLYELWRRRGMSVRVGAHFPTMNFEHAQRWLDYPAAGFGDDMLLLNGLGEGVLNAMGDGYIPKQFPIAPEAKAELQKIVAAGARNQVSFQFHATIETTMNAMLDALEAAHTQTPIDKLRINFLHAEQITPSIIARMKKLGMGVQMQNRQSLGSELMKANWGERANDIPPVKTVINSGLPFAGGTDGTTSSSYRPFISIGWLVSGKNWRGDLVRPTERLTREQALRAYTRGSAWFTWEENRKGAITPGMLADFIVLDRDYLTVNEDDIRFIKPVLTAVGGKVVYDAAR
ncbi:MAG: amidohydrolase [Betaproteobacteria bacterium]